MQMSSTFDVAIVGAGAAGLATAAFLTRLNPSRSVLLLEGARKPGAKILISGGSRCSVTNISVSERDFWGSSHSGIRHVLRHFSVDDTRAFFARIGVTLHEEADGKLFPDSNRSRDVLDALLREVERGGALLRAGDRVTAITAGDHGLNISTSQGSLQARHVVLATGGRALPKSGSDGAGYEMARNLGHTIVETTPALAPLLLDPADTMHAALSGVAHKAELSIWIDGRIDERLTGALLWTHFGVSGPVALNASRVWGRAVLERRNAAVTMCLFPGLEFDDVDARLVTLLQTRPRASIATLLATLLPVSLVEVLVESCGIGAAITGAQVDRDRRRRLAHMLAAWPLKVLGTRGYTYAEATAGGVPLAEINPHTMESKRCPRLFFVGEIVDVDGRLGGFNFQWAWSSAWVAARALARGEAGKGAVAGR